MGVGAVFISTMAITRLPEAHHPPQSREDYLFIALESLVPFLVLSSIVVRKSCTQANMIHKKRLNLEQTAFRSPFSIWD